MRYLLALLCLTATTQAQLINTGIPQEPTIYVVTAPWCAPCQRFQSDWDNIPGLAELIGTQYAVKRCNWDRPSDQMWARRRGVTQIPTFLVCYRGEIVERWSGYNGNWREVLQKLGLDDYVNDDGSIGPRKPAPAQSRQEPTPTPAPAVDLKPINDRLGNLEGLIRNLSQSREVPKQEANPFADPAPKPKPQPKPKPTPQPTAAATQEAKPGGLASSWGSVLSVLGQVALTAAAPHVALPAGALGVAGFLLRQLRRSGASNSEPRQVVRQQTVREVPVVVATDTPPPPAKVVTTSHYVPVERESHREAWQWAADNYARKYPGSEGLIQTLNSMISQYETSKQEGK